MDLVGGYLYEGHAASERKRKSFMKIGKKKDLKRKARRSHAPRLSADRFKPLYLSLLIVVLTFLSFSPVLQSGFLWDDDAVTDNPFLKSVDGLYKIWFTPSLMTKEAHNWPLAYTAFWIQYQIWGLQPLGYHLVNLFLHSINVLLIWKIFSRIDNKSAYFAALLFAVHPVHVEAVAWIIELKDVLSVTFYLSAFLLFMKFHEKRKLACYVLCILAFAAALLTKSMTVTLPAAIILWILAKNRRMSFQNILLLSPFAFIAVAVVWGDVNFAQGREIMTFDYSLWERVRIASHAVFFYIGKLVFPFHLVTFYPRWNWVQNSLLSYLPALILALVLASLFLMRRYSPAPLFLFLFYLVTLSPILGFLNFYFMTFSFVADRYQYLASAGLLFLFSMGAFRLFHLFIKDKGSAFLVFQILAIAVLSILTFYQTALYKDNETLFKHNVEINPRAWAAHNNLGVEYQNQGKFTLAIQHYTDAVELNPRFMDAHNNLGILLAQDGELDDALDHFQTALSIKPRDSRTLANIGIVYSIRKDYDSAISHLQKALQEDPASVNASFNLALVYIGKDELENAVFYLHKTLEIDPSHPGANAKLNELGYWMGNNPKDENPAVK
jgi:tetratricopeptide (TPR) repeat protein